MVEKRTIEFDRKNISLRIILALIFFGIGIWLAFGNTSILGGIPKFDDPTFRKFMGFVIQVVALVGVAFLIRCLVTNKPGFVADKDGLYFQNTIIPKEIYWNEIESIEKYNLKFFFFSWRVLKIVTKNSEKSEKLVSPFLLNISLEELSEILNDSLQKTTANSGFTP